MNKLSKTKTLFVFVLLSIMLVITLCACAKEEEKINPLTADVQIGDEVGFGVSYETPIVWRVLAVQDEKALLTIAHDIKYENIGMSRSNVVIRLPMSGGTSVQYHDEWGMGVSWEDCYLREWLNDKFLLHFSESEQNRIQLTELSDESGVKDKVFIFSMEEAERYFPDDDSRILYYTDEDGAERTAPWWLRSPDKTHDAPCIEWDGSISPRGFMVNGYLCFRPAMWVSLDGLEIMNKYKSSKKMVPLEKLARAIRKILHFVQDDSYNSYYNMLEKV